MPSPITTESAALLRAAKAAGGQAALARALGYKGRGNVWPWFKGRPVPAEKCPEIEALFGVRCEELRPDVAWQVLRAAPVSTPAAEEARDAA